jgi:hypothetical protein
VYLELKNRYNTVKSSDLPKTIYEPLAQYRLENPDTIVIYGIVNPRPGSKVLTSTFLYKGVSIQKIQGLDLFRYICVYEGYNYSDKVIEFTKNFLKELYNH